MKFQLSKQITLGTAYYPEHWDSKLWEEDIIRMQEHGIDLLRIGDFAWSKYEFREGEFTIGYFDDFLELCTKHKMQVLFCTPTAAPPAWAVHQYPDILNISRDGHTYRGDRRFYNYNSSIYKTLCERIVTKLAKHYSKWDCIVGWQVDNEVNCDLSEFYSEADNQAFREYLKEKFKTLEQLNEALGLTFWSRSYSDWEQICLSNGGVANASNPHMMLEQRRFFSKSACDFCWMQAKIIRAYLPDGKFITTNGLFQNLDYDQLLDKDFDFITYDSYPNFAFDLEKDPKQPGNLNDRKWSWNMMWTRSASEIFGIMEQQAGANGWTTRMETPMPRPGQMRLWTMQSIAHGADLVSYFRWRTSPIGCEIYWHGLNDYSNMDNRRLRELKVIAKDISHLQCLSEATYDAKAAILKDYTNVWDASVDVWHGRVDYFSENSWFVAAQLTHTPCDFLFLREKMVLEDLKKYKLLIYPHGAIMDERISNLLLDYVKDGGTLVLGARTGYKDVYGRCPMRAMPGLVGKWCGVTVIDYTLTSPVEEEMTVSWGDVHVSAPIFNEVLSTDKKDVEVLAHFDAGYYQGKPAMCRRNIEKGRVYYLGACFSIEMAKEILKVENAQSPYEHLLSIPETVELAVRADANAEYLFLLNYKNQPAQIRLFEPLYDIIHEKIFHEEIKLEAFGVAALRLAKNK